MSQSITIPQNRKFQNDIMIKAAEEGLAYIVQSMLDMGADDYDNAIQAAVQNNHPGIVNTLKEYDLSNDTIFEILMSASREGHRDVLDILINAIDYNKYSLRNALSIAAGEGNTGIILPILDEIESKYSPNDYDNALQSAVINGNLDIVNILIDRSNEYDCIEFMAVAGERGHRDIVNRFLELGCAAYNHTMAYAAGNAHMDIVQQMIDLGADEYVDSANNAIYGHHNDIVRNMIELGGDDFDDTAYDELMESAIMGGNVRGIQMLSELHDYNYDDLMDTAFLSEILESIAKIVELKNDE